MKAKTDNCLCFSTSPRQLVVVGFDRAEKWTMNKDSALTLTHGVDVEVRK